MFLGLGIISVFTSLSIAHIAQLIEASGRFNLALIFLVIAFSLFIMGFSFIISFFKNF